MVFVPKKGNPDEESTIDYFLPIYYKADFIWTHKYNFVPLKGGCHWILLASVNKVFLHSIFYHYILG